MWFITFSCTLVTSYQAYTADPKGKAAPIVKPEASDRDPPLSAGTSLASRIEPPSSNPRPGDYSSSSVRGSRDWSYRGAYDDRRPTDDRYGGAPPSATRPGATFDNRPPSSMPPPSSGRDDRYYDRDDNRGNYRREWHDSRDRRPYDNNNNRNTYYNRGPDTRRPLENHAPRRFDSSRDVEPPCHSGPGGRFPPDRSNIPQQRPADQVTSPRVTNTVPNSTTSTAGAAEQQRPVDKIPSDTSKPSNSAVENTMASKPSLQDRLGPLPGQQQQPTGKGHGHTPGSGAGTTTPVDSTARHDFEKLSLEDRIAPSGTTVPTSPSTASGHTATTLTAEGGKHTRGECLSSFVKLKWMLIGCY